MAKTASRLGRGLGSLIAGGSVTPPSSEDSRAKVLPPSSPENGNLSGRTKQDPVPARNSSKSNSEMRGENLLEIALGTLVPNPRQPRKVIDPEAIQELAASIEAEGLLQPVVVRRSGDSFELIAGERRWRAHEFLGREKILARVLEVSDLSSASLSLIENLQREGLNPMEEAMGYHSLVHDFSLTQAKVAKRVGKSRVYVTNLLRLLQLDEELRGFLASGKLSTGHAKVLLGLSDEGKRLELAKRAISEQWTVRQCEQAVDEIRNPRNSRSVLSVAGSNGNQYSLHAQQAQSALKREVSIKAGPSGKGRISLAFEDQKDLEKILASLGV
jgi:ParB family transcriptional regulator, chromosome partitioning protein